MTLLGALQTIFLLLLCQIVMAQDEQMDKEIQVTQTFKDTRVINSHSVETLPAHKLDFRIGHRFGDAAGGAGGWPTFYGLENATDVLIGFEYGLTDYAMIGINRTKGAGPLKQNVNSLVKYRLITQEINGNQPLSLTVLGVATISTMPKSETEGVLHFFEKSAHRWSYHMGLHIARKFSDRLSIQINGSWTYRNIVASTDKNDLVSVGGSLRLQATRAMAFIVDTNIPFSDLRKSENGYYPSLGIGFEFDTGGGHRFQINLTNATGLSETDYIPYNRSNWGDGEFRMGFTISRLFSL